MSDRNSDPLLPDSLPPEAAPDDPGDLNPPPQDDLPPAAGSIDDPLDPGETQPGDSMEQAQNIGGPIDIFPAGRRRGPLPPMTPL